MITEFKKTKTRPTHKHLIWLDNTNDKTSLKFQEEKKESPVLVISHTEHRLHWNNALEVPREILRISNSVTSKTNIFSDLQ